ncbi:MAG TPA: diaminopimelate epimerase [Frankiaceae bacterium]|nr:diaminopimelate epimerase [Frankiaceae bacterium]
MRFTKGHGTANDFVLLPDPSGTLALGDDLVRALCDRRRGIGADGVLRVVPTAAVPEVADQAGEAEWFMDYRNADGGAVEMCGNGVRVFARYLVTRGYASGPSLAIATRDGVKRVELVGDDVRVDMGAPSFEGRAPDGATFVSMGNPHVVFFVPSVASAPVLTEGPRIEAATPGGTNVEYAAVSSRSAVAMRVWERGVGETQSCGTGACAVAVAAALNDLAERRVAVTVPGGDLAVEWTDETVYLTGPAVLVADGEWLGA